MVADVGDLEREVGAEVLLHGQVPGLSVGISERGRNIGIDLTDERRRTGGNDSVGGNGNRNRGREARLEGSHGDSITKDCRRICRTTRGLIAVVGADRVVVGIGVIRERNIADAESTANNSGVGDPVGESGARCEVVVFGDHAEVGRVGAQASQNDGVVGWIVV